MARSFQGNDDFYADEELRIMKERWLQDQAQIDSNPVFGYQHDRDRERIRVLANKELQTLFKHASYLYLQIKYEGGLILFPGEQQKIIAVYKEIEKNGYYSRSRKEERRTRVHLGKIISRQAYARRRR